jgi:hypothetical protein
VSLPFKGTRSRASSKQRDKERAAQPKSESLKGWQQIAAFLGQPIAVVQRWASTGMPVTRQGRYVAANEEELNKWLGRESGGEPVRVATEQTDLSAELKRGLSYIQREKRQLRKPPGRRSTSRSGQRP